MQLGRVSAAATAREGSWSKRRQRRGKAVGASGGNGERRQLEQAAATAREGSWSKRRHPREKAVGASSGKVAATQLRIWLQIGSCCEVVGSSRIGEGQSLVHAQKRFSLAHGFSRTTDSGLASGFRVEQQVQRPSGAGSNLERVRKGNGSEEDSGL
eukprot:354801-Chlamydomonas_euryale.AAC.2